jgi:hypothetical protein
MRRSTVAAVIALAGFAAAVSGCGSAANAGASLTSASCGQASTSVHAKTETRYCGPATATLHLDGQTYKFKDGGCSKDDAIGLKLGVTLGTIDYGNLKTNGGLPLFQLQIDKQPVAVTTVNASWGGRRLIELHTVTTKHAGSMPLSGTFRSVTGAYGGSKHFSGSWDCGGTISGS